MLESISWPQFFFILLLANLVYYLFVWVVFLKAKLPALPGSANFHLLSQHGEDEPDEVMTTVQHIMDELRPLFQARTNKNELLYALQRKLRKYNQWDETGFRNLINDFIAAESETVCSIHLSEEDLRVLW